MRVGWPSSEVVHLSGGRVFQASWGGVIMTVSLRQVLGRWVGKGGYACSGDDLAKLGPSE